MRVFLAMAEPSVAELCAEGGLPFGHKNVVRDPEKSQKLTVERQCMFAVDKADIVFAWVGKEPLAPHMRTALCYAYGLKKFICAAVSKDCSKEDFRLLTELSSLPQLITYPNVETAYLVTMDDNQEHSTEKFVPILSAYAGLCNLCGGSYEVGDSLMWCRKHGAAHRHCYEIQQDSARNGTFVFSQELVQVLQQKITRLEYQNLQLEAKCQTLEESLRKGGGRDE